LSGDFGGAGDVAVLVVTPAPDVTVRVALRVTPASLTNLVFRFYTYLPTYNIYIDRARLRNRRPGFESRQGVTFNREISTMLLRKLT
jgi:hypothetical protein